MYLSKQGTCLAPICNIVGSLPDSGELAPEDEANARLIAAAPELLAACENVIDYHNCGDDPSTTYDRMVRTAHAAIANATTKAVPA